MVELKAKTIFAWQTDSILVHRTSERTKKSLEIHFNFILNKTPTQIGNISIYLQHSVPRNAEGILEMLRLIDMNRIVSEWIHYNLNVTKTMLSLSQPINYRKQGFFLNPNISDLKNFSFKYTQCIRSLTYVIVHRFESDKSRKKWNFW